MMVRSPAVAVSVSLAALFAAAAPAQQVLLPIQDLLQTRTTRDPYIEILRSDMLNGGRRFAGECRFAGITPDSNRPWLDSDASGWFTADQLQTVLGALGVQHATRVIGGFLATPEANGDAARRVLDDLRQRLPPTIVADVRLERTTGGATRQLLARTITVQPGRVCVASDARVHNAVVDYAVEIAQSAMVGNPIPGQVRSGAMVALRAQTPLTAEWAVLELVARWVEDDPGARIDTGDKWLGPIDRVPLAYSETGRVLRVRPGSTTTQTWSADGSEYRLTLRTQWQLPQPVRPGGHDVAIFSMRGDLSGFRSVPVRQREGSEAANDPDHEEPWANLGDLAGSDAEWLIADVENEENNASLFVAVDRAMWAVGATAMAWFEAMKPAAPIDVRCYDVPSGTAWPDDGSVPAGAKALGGTRLDLVDGSWSATCVREDHTVLTDWDVEVAQSARIPDPQPTRLSTGFCLNVRATGDRVELDGEISRVVDEGRHELTLSAPIFMPEQHNAWSSGSGVSKSDSPALALLPDIVAVEHPVVAKASLRLARLVDVQHPAVHRQSATALLGDGHDVVLVVTRPK